MPLGKTLTAYWQRLQGHLFPWLEEELGPLGDRHRRLVTVLDVVGVEALLPDRRGGVGCPPSDRAALARAFVAKAVFNLPTTGLLIERLSVDTALRRLCGWERLGSVPSGSTFSRAFAEFARSALPSRLHQALIERTHAERLVGHVSRDSTAIEAREKPAAMPGKPKRRRGRPRKGEEAPPRRRRLERQLDMTLEEMLADLPRHCAVGTKRSAKGYRTSWTGYKLHLDVADGMVPLSALLSAASLHDSQAAIPLATLTAARVTSLYDLMDSAYDVGEIKDHSRSLGHVPIIEANPWGQAERKRELALEAERRRYAGYQTAEKVRYGERTAAERVNARLKDDFGGRMVRVRGHDKVMCHLMFGVLALTVDQLMRLVP